MASDLEARYLERRLRAGPSRDPARLAVRHGCVADEAEVVDWDACPHCV